MLHISTFIWLDFIHKSHLWHRKYGHFKNHCVVVSQCLRLWNKICADYIYRYLTCSYHCDHKFLTPKIMPCFGQVFFFRVGNNITSGHNRVGGWAQCRSIKWSKNMNGAQRPSLDPLWPLHVLQTLQIDGGHDQ